MAVAQNQPHPGVVSLISDRPDLFNRRSRLASLEAYWHHQIDWRWSRDCTRRPVTRTPMPERPRR